MRTLGLFSTGWEAGIYEGRRVVLRVADGREETGRSPASRTLTAAWASSSQVQDDTQDCPTEPRVVTIASLARPPAHSLALSHRPPTAARKIHQIQI